MGAPVNRCQGVARASALARCCQARRPDGRAVSRSLLVAPLLAALLAGSPAHAASPEPRVTPRPASAAAGLALEVGQGKPTVLHFWATWCGACRDEFPRIRKALLALPAQGIAVALVSIDTPAELAKVKAQLTEFGVAALPCILLDAPDPGVVARALRDDKFDGSLPATVLFNGQGKRVLSFIGQTDTASLQAAVAKLVPPSKHPPPK